MTYFQTIEVAPQRDESTHPDQTWFETCEPSEATEWSVFGINENGDGELLDSFPYEWQADCFAAGARLALAGDDANVAATAHVHWTLTRWDARSDGIDYALQGRKAVEQKELDRVFTRLTPKN